MNLDAQIEKKVLDYLAENLPPTEERHPEPMHPECEVVVLIPAYAERNYILMTIESLAYQENVSKAQYEVMVVVNNSPSEPVRCKDDNEAMYKEVLELYRTAIGDNQETLKLIRRINGEDVEFAVSPEEEEIIKRIRQSGMKLYAIDKASAGKTLPQQYANVGGARNRGLAEAVERFYKHAGRNGIVAQTDADTCVDEYYIRSLIDAFKERPKTAAIGGTILPMLYKPGTAAEGRKMEELLIGRSAMMYGWLLNTMAKKWVLNTHGKGIVYFTGCNMASRAFETAIVGGIPKIPGAEDTELSVNILAAGETDIVDEVIVFQGVRYSARTTTGYGMNMMRCADDIQKKGEILVRSPEFILVITALNFKLRKAFENKQTSVEQLDRILTYSSRSILDKEDLERLSSAFGQVDDPSQALSNKSIRAILEKMRDRVENLVSMMPIIEATELLISLYCMIDDINEKYQGIKQKIIDDTRQSSILLDRILDDIYKDNLQKGETGILEDLIASNLEKNDTEFAREVLKKRHIIRHLAGIIASSGTKEQASGLIRVQYLEYLVMPEEPLLVNYLNMRALDATLSNVQLDKTVVEMLLSSLI